jgi:collagen type I alpha
VIAGFGPRGELPSPLPLPLSLPLSLPFRLPCAPPSSPPMHPLPLPVARPDGSPRPFRVASRAPAPRGLAPDGPATPRPRPYALSRRLLGPAAPAPLHARAPVARRPLAPAPVARPRGPRVRAPWRLVPAPRTPAAACLGGHRARDPALACLRHAQRVRARDCSCAAFNFQCNPFLILV